MSKIFISVAVTLACITSATLRAQESQDSPKTEHVATLDDGKFKPPKPHGDINTLVNYPPEAAKEHREGRVTVALLIDEHGSVLKTLVKSVTDSVFVSPTLAAVKRLTFAPATHAGTPVKAWLTMPVHFKLKKK